MKKVVFLAVVFFGTGNLVFAQQDTTTVYVDENLNIIKTPKGAAFTYRSYQENATNWIIATFDKQNQLIKKERYNDASLLLAEGLSVEYDNDRPILKGMYYQGKRKGNWITYDTLGNVSKLANYLSGRLNGVYKEFWQNGNLKEEGNYDWGAKKGQWKFFYDNGKLASNEVFEIESRSPLKGEYFDINGNLTTKEKVRMPPIFNAGKIEFINYISRKIAETSTNMLAIVGKVECTFTIDKMGRTGNIKIISHNGNFLKEARAAILSSPRWTPGTLFGDVVNSESSLVIVFVR